jgi:hypothetical protein
MLIIRIIHKTDKNTFEASLEIVVVAGRVAARPVP